MLKSLNLGLLCVAALTTCAVASAQSTPHGKSYGGQAPVNGAHVYLYSPAITAGGASKSLFVQDTNSFQDAAGNWYAITASDGSFSFPHYNCTNGAVPVYLYGAGGDAGNGLNPAISELAYVGVCGSISPTSYYFMNEATTVATAYAAAGYASDPLHISFGGSSVGLTGIINAFANANNLVNVTTGNTNSVIPSGTFSVPQATINTIANALAICINQAQTGTYCSDLFNATKVGSVTVTDTATAALNIAHYPGSSTAPGIQHGTNISKIVTLGSTYPQQFSPYLMQNPPDLTLALTFSGNGIANPNALAVDGLGNVWVASSKTLEGASPTVVEIVNASNMLSTNNSFGVSFTLQDNADAVALDKQSQTLWIGTDSAVEAYSTTGTSAPGSPFLNGDPNLNGAYALNLDNAGNVWIAGYSSIYELSSTGTDLSNGGYALPGTNPQPSAIAFDYNNNAWVTDEINNSLLEVTPSQGSATITATPSTALLNAPFSVAIDGANNIHVANNGDNGFVTYVPTATQNPFSKSAATTPVPNTLPLLTAIGLDGSGQSWASLEGAYCSSAASCLSVAAVDAAGNQITGPGYYAGGYTHQEMSSTASATAIDSAGNVWILNKSAQSVTELIGAAAPVITPLAYAVANSGLTAKP